MTSIPVQGQSGTIIGLEVVPATDGSGNLVPVVQVQNASDITIGGLSLPDVEAGLVPGTAPDAMIVGGLAYNSTPPSLTNGQTVALQGDSSGNLLVDIAKPLPPGSNVIGTVNATGTVTANAGTNLNTSALALESGGNLATIATAQGAGGISISQPTGGSGILGWLSGIYKALINTITVSGTVTANAGTNMSTAALALEGGGNLATLAGTVATGKVKVDPSGVTSPVSLASLPELPSGTNTIGAFNQGTAGSSAWKVDPSGVTSPVAVESMPSIPAGSNTIGGVTLPDVEGYVSPAVAPAKMLVGGLVYNSTPPILTNDQGAALQGDNAGNLKTTIATELPAGTNTLGGVLVAPTASSSFAITPGASSALEAGHILKASAGNLYSLYGLSTDVDGYLMTFNATSIPADGAVTPIECIPVFSGSSATIDFSGTLPDQYSTGIVAVFSTTGPFTKTASATAFFKWRVQ
jgi:hypothetical protein